MREKKKAKMRKKKKAKMHEKKKAKIREKKKAKIREKRTVVTDAMKEMITGFREEFKKTDIHEFKNLVFSFNAAPAPYNNVVMTGLMLAHTAMLHSETKEARRKAIIADTMDQGIVCFRDEFKKIDLDMFENLVLTFQDNKLVMIALMLSHTAMLNSELSLEEV